MEINIKKDGIYDINLPYGTLVLRVEQDKVEVEQVGKQNICFSKETLIANAEEDVLFALFNTFIEYLKILDPDRFDELMVFDADIGKIIHQLKYHRELPRVEQTVVR